ncbi:MAG: SRPBCC family protein [Bryobacteraceae bacterium]
MADIYHRFVIHGPPAQVFEAISTAAGLDSWWTLTSSGLAEPGAAYEFGFGPSHQWRAVAVCCETNSVLEWQITAAMDDWLGTRVGFTLHKAGDVTEVEFHHAGWTEATPHFRTTSYCWAMYLRLLKRFVEAGEVVPYGDRLEA